MENGCAGPRPFLLGGVCSGEWHSEVRPHTYCHGGGTHIPHVATSHGKYSFFFPVVRLFFKGVSAFQPFKGARIQWFWLLNRKLGALSVPLSWLEGLGLEPLLYFKGQKRSFVWFTKTRRKPFLEACTPALVETQHGRELPRCLAVMTANKCV